LLAAVNRLHRTAGQFAGISGPMKDRVINDPPGILGQHALDLASKLRLRAQTLEGELESIAKDQLILSEALAHLVRDSFDMLGKAERGSERRYRQHPRRCHERRCQSRPSAVSPVRRCRGASGPHS
jgi:hypothetical protein